MAGKHYGDGDGDANDSGGSAFERDEVRVVVGQSVVFLRI